MNKIYHKFGITSALAQGLCLSLLCLKFWFNFDLITSSKLQLITPTVLATIIVLSKHFEGWNLSIIPNGLCTLLLSIALWTTTATTTSNATISIIFSLFAFIAWLLHLLAIAHFFSYKFNTPKGPFYVGFRSVRYQDLSISIFYPTEASHGNRARYYPDRLAVEKFYESSSVDKPLPRWIFNIFNDIANKARTNAYVDAPLLPPSKPPLLTVSKEQFVPVIFSHGLALHRNSNSILCTELASRGHIVFSIDHIEDIKGCAKAKNESDLVREYQAKRVREVRKLMDILEKGQLLVDVFQTKVPVALDKIILMGHSFGGSTAIATALEDKRVYDCVVIDPWLAVLKKDEELRRKLTCNLFLIESETEDAAEPEAETRARHKILMDAQKNNGKRALYVIANRTDHMSFADCTLFFAPTFKREGLVSHLDEVHDMMGYWVEMIAKYAELVRFEDSSDGKQNPKELEFVELLKNNDKISYQAI